MEIGEDDGCVFVNRENFGISIKKKKDYNNACIAYIYILLETSNIICYTSLSIFSSYLLPPRFLISSIKRKEKKKTKK